MKFLISSIFSMIILVAGMSVMSCSRSDHPVDGYLCSGPEGGGHSDFAPGVIDSTYGALRMRLGNRTTNGSYENVLLLTRGEGKMGLVLEDTFRYAIQKGVAESNMELIAAAARLKVFMVAFYSDVFILVNKSSGISTIADLAGKKVSIAEIDSGTYVTAKAIFEAYGIPLTGCNNESTRTALPKVVSGEYDALIKVTADKGGYFGALKPTDNVTFIRAELPGKVLYDHNGTIRKEDFPFLAADVTDNIRVRVLLVGTPEFDDRDMARLLDDMYANADLYAENYTDIWKTVSLSDSLRYFGESPYAWNLKCASYFTGISEIASAQTNLACGTAGGSTEIIGGNMLASIKSTMGLDLTIINTTGSPEMAINIANGSAAMAIVIDDVYNYLNNLDTSFDQFTALSMRKIMPLFYEDCHLLVNTGSGINTMAELAKKKVCVCEKTSGTFIVARNVLKTYGFTKENAPVYYFEDPVTAVPKVVSGYYDAMFKVSAQPYSKFNTLIKSGDPVKFIQVKVKDGTVGAEYDARPILQSNYSGWMTGGDVGGNVCVRGLLVASSAVNDSAAGDLIDALYVAAATPGFDAKYWGDVTPAKGNDYFKKKPYGWSKHAAKYFLEKLGYTVTE